MQLSLELLLIHVLHEELQGLHIEQGSSVQLTLIESIKYPSKHTQVPIWPLLVAVVTIFAFS